MSSNFSNTVSSESSWWRIYQFVDVEFECKIFIFETTKWSVVGLLIAGNRRIIGHTTLMVQMERATCAEKNTYTVIYHYLI